MRAAEFAALVKVTGRRGPWYDALCPVHEGPTSKSSFSFRDGDHAVTLKCHAGCTREQILAVLRLTPEDLRFETRDNGGPPSRREIVATYDYRDERGTLLFQVVRFEPKDFRQRRPDGHGGWIWSVTGVRRVMYRLDELAESIRVHQSESEKDADRLVSLGLRATSSPGGADGWRDEYADQVKAAGVAEMILLPHQDAAGDRYTALAARSYLRRMIQVKVVALPGLAEHGDVSDWLDAGHTLEEFLALVEATPWLLESPEVPPASSEGAHHRPARR